MVWSGFAAWNFVFVFLQSFVSTWGLEGGARTELCSDGPGFEGELPHRVKNPWGLVFPGAGSALLGTRAPGLLKSMWCNGLPQVFMTQFPASSWEMDKFGSIFRMERYQCFFLIPFQAGDHSPRFQKYNARSLAEVSRWGNILDRAASALYGGVRPILFFQSWQLPPHCEVDRVNLEWNRNSQWEREKPWKRPWCLWGQGLLYTVSVTVKPPRAEWIAGMSMYVKIVSQGFETIFRRNAHFGSFKDVSLAA